LFDRRDTWRDCQPVSPLPSLYGSRGFRARHASAAGEAQAIIPFRKIARLLPGHPASASHERIALGKG
ncbi:MAG: hypothetical protein OXC93_15225, partial [Rhodospirillaceae bacterium]|nr:hypothetical protein [Rhodospirillaceae bacterium]